MLLQEKTLLPTPKELKLDLPLLHQEFIEAGRKCARDILSGRDKRLLIIAGPCSVHDTQEALDYAYRFKQLAEEVKETCFLIMRAYVEKPRTTTGWKGFLYDPYLNGTNDIETGFYKSRELFLALAEMGVPAAAEYVDPLAAPYFDDLITWGFIGARTSASQTHRQLASILPFPVGFKNGTDGNIDPAINGVVSARNSHSFIYLNEEGRLCKTHSNGNPFTHIVLRGSTEETNFDPESVNKILKKMSRAGIASRLIIDCAHGNSQKQHERQKHAFQSALAQIVDGNSNIMGMMLESHLEAGNQSLGDDASSLRYAVSITDPCIDWDSTVELVREADSIL